jgi:hypothetical protein
MGNSIFKVPGGKLLKIKLTPSEGRILVIVIKGDFFLHPEETLVALEEFLAGKELDEATLAADIQDFLDEAGATLVGASAADMAKAILMAR